MVNAIDQPHAAALVDMRDLVESEHYIADLPHVWNGGLVRRRCRGGASDAGGTGGPGTLAAGTVRIGGASPPAGTVCSGAGGGDAATVSRGEVDGVAGTVFVTGGEGESSNERWAMRNFLRGGGGNDDSGGFICPCEGTASISAH